MAICAAFPQQQHKPRVAICVTTFPAHCPVATGAAKRVKLYLLASSKPYGAPQLWYPTALYPQHASVCVEAGHPIFPRARRNPEIPLGEDIRRAGGRKLRVN